MKRRHFLKTLSISGAYWSLASFLNCTPSTKKPLRILILGGTNFVGPAIVNAALDQGHQITLFNRGITNPGLFPQLPLIKGDREKGIDAYQPLKEQSWDVVIDVWPEHAQLVDDASLALQDHTDHYVFISSIAVYQNFQEVGLNEKSALVGLESNPENWGYSEEKRYAESLVKKRFPNRFTILRPGAIKGWRDPAMDLLYWLVRLQNNESILAPGSGKDPLQFVDVKDVGRLTLFAIEQKHFGVFNCIGQYQPPLFWKDFLEGAKKQLQSTSDLYWGSEDFLRINKVRSFEDLPLWAPLSEDRGFMQISNQKSLVTGFQYTPWQATLKDCLKWQDQKKKNNPQADTPDNSVGLKRSRELQLIEQLLHD